MGVNNSMIELHLEKGTCMYTYTHTVYIIISLFPSTLYYIRIFEKKIYNGNGDS